MVTFGGACLVARRGFGCGALGLAGTCSQGSANSAGSSSAAAGGRGSAVTVCRLSLTGGLAAPGCCFTLYFPDRSFIQLSELEHFRVNRLVQCFNAAAHDLNPSPFSRESEALLEPLRSIL